MQNVFYVNEYAPMQNVAIVPHYNHTLQPEFKQC